MSPLAVAVAFSTRRETIALARVVGELRRRSTQVRSHVVALAQFRELTDLVAADFALKIDDDLNCAALDQDRVGTAAATLDAVAASLTGFGARWVVLEGQSVTTVASALAAFWSGIRICHVGDWPDDGRSLVSSPEDVHRRLIAQLADLHCVPDAAARDRLVDEDVAPERVAVCGNPVVDTLAAVEERSRRGLPDELDELVESNRLVLVAARAREGCESHLKDIAEAVRHIAQLLPDVCVLWPVHPEPATARIVWQEFAQQSRIHLIAAQPYGSFISLLRRADLVLTDSVAVEQEAAILGRPALFVGHPERRASALRDEPNEASASGDSSAIELEAIRLLLNPPAVSEAATARKGASRGARRPKSGKVAARIVDALLRADRRISRSQLGCPAIGTGKPVM